MQVWVWEYPTEGEDGQSGHHDLYMDPGEEIRFRITSEAFVDTSPTGSSLVETGSLQNMPHLPSQGSTAGAIVGAPTASVSLDPESTRLEEKKVPFHIKASINEPGLGLLSWWKNS